MRGAAAVGGVPPSPLEQAERLEQLRALENGIEIAVRPVEYEAIGVDVPEDVQRVGVAE